MTSKLFSPNPHFSLDSCMHDDKLGNVESKKKEPGKYRPVNIKFTPKEYESVKRRAHLLKMNLCAFFRHLVQLPALPVGGARERKK